MKKQTNKKSGGTFNFGFPTGNAQTTTPPTNTPPSFSFGVPTSNFNFGVPTNNFNFGVPDNNQNPVSYQQKNFAAFRGDKTKLSKLIENYDYRNLFEFKIENDIRLAVPKQGSDTIYLFRGIATDCDKLYLDKDKGKSIWLSNFKVARIYSQNRSVIAYKASTALKLFELSYENVEKMFDYYQETNNQEKIKHIQFATGINCTNEQQKTMFNDYFKNTRKWYDITLPKNINRVGITETDILLIEAIKEFCAAKRLNDINGYYADVLHTPMAEDNVFHEEVCLFNVEEQETDREYSYCTFETGSNSGLTVQSAGKSKRSKKADKPLKKSTGKAQK
jgi:hypothetical protein